MAQDASSEDHVLLSDLRQRRAELRDSMSTLEQALAGPAPKDTAGWVDRVRTALIELSGDLRLHIQITEGPEGLYQDLLRTAPRLGGAVTRLTRDHVRITDQLEALLALTERTGAAEQVEVIRARGTALLGRVVRHRQQGADLVYEAYQVDIGGADD